MAKVELATPQDKFMTYEIDLEFNSKTVVSPLDVVDAKLIFTFSQGKMVEDKARFREQQPLSRSLYSSLYNCHTVRLGDRLIY